MVTEDVQDPTVLLSLIELEDNNWDFFSVYKRLLPFHGSIYTKSKYRGLILRRENMF